MKMLNEKAVTKSAANASTGIKRSAYNGSSREEKVVTPVRSPRYVYSALGYGSGKSGFGSDYVIASEDIIPKL
jgi:hypothetical protein